MYLRQYGSNVNDDYFTAPLFARADQATECECLSCKIQGQYSQNQEALEVDVLSSVEQFCNL